VCAIYVIIIIIARLAAHSTQRSETQPWDRATAQKTKRSKRQVSKETFHKWQRTYERNHQSMAWLRTDMDDQDKSIFVSTLRCFVCLKYETRKCGLKNFSRVWIDGSSNHKMGNITDHTNNEQHKSAMMYLRKDQAKSRNEPISSHSPIARSLLLSPMDPAVRE